MTLGGSGVPIDHQVWIYEDKHHFEFYLQSCGEAVVYLSQDALVSSINDTNSYEITLGAAQNTQIHLKKYPNGELLQTAHMPEVVTCHGARRFWITWYSGDLTIGTGSLFTRSVMVYSKEPYILVRTISLMVKPNAGFAYWEFPKDAGNTVLSRMSMVL